MSAEVADMVIRCAKTGKLFFSEKDAKQHGEDTGFAEFEQVSLDDKVWVCVETGKVCVTRTEMDVYKRRDPEAKTFEEKTVAYLKEQYASSKAAAAAAKEGTSAGDTVPMEVDAEGSGAPAAAPAAPRITKETLDQLLEMGFPRPRAARALVETSNAGLEPAVAWLADHGDDTDVDAPLDMEPEVLSQADIDAALAAAAAGKSAQLTPEEKQAKLQAAMEAAQRKREEKEKDDAKAREMARRESGKAMVKTKAELEEMQRKRDREQRRKEKEDDARHRQMLREQLERDKAERRAERAAKGLPPLASDAPKPPEAAATPSASAAPPAPTATTAPAAPSTQRAAQASAPIPVVPLAEAIATVCTNRDFLLDAFVETAGKLAANVKQNPAELKYRHIRTSNPKIHERLIRPVGGETFLAAVGWRRDGDGLSLPQEVEPNAFADAVAELSRKADESKQERARAEREKLRAEREAAMKAKKEEKERLRRAMEADRREIATRGPAETVRASSLPSAAGGSSVAVHRLDLDEDPRDNDPGATADA